VDLRTRLANTRWPDQPSEPAAAGGWNAGTELSYLQELVGYWRSGFDWRRQEALLNTFDNYRTRLQGVDLHFIHQPGIGPAPMPLLLSHGWPGSVWEFHKLIPMLTDPARFGGDPADAFTVIAPSLPGFGFSFRPNQPRLGTEAVADAFAELMTDTLRYPRYAAAGGDLGPFYIARLAHRFPERLHGIHLTILPFRRNPKKPPTPSPQDQEYQRGLEFMAGETGYSAEQSTKPQTLAYGLTDSPAGLAAWIVEKFRTWSDCGGDIESRFSKDELLTNISIYWFTGAIGSSFWPYYDRAHGAWSMADMVAKGQRIEVPTAYAVFPKETLRPSAELVTQGFNLQRYTRMPAGGHFAALEEPRLLATDLVEFFRAYR